MFNQLLLLGTIPLFSLLGATLETFAKKVPEVLSEVTLKAEVDKRAIPQVQEAFGKYSIETPELFEGNHRDFERSQPRVRTGICVFARFSISWQYR